MTNKKIFQCVSVLILMSAYAAALFAAPGDTLFFDNFNRANPATAALTDGVGNSWVVGGGGACTGAAGRQGCAGIDTDSLPWSTTPTAIRARGAGSQTLFLRWSTVTVDHALNLSGKPGAQLTFWLRRGSDCFSEMPGDPGSDPGCLPAARATITVTGNRGATTVSSITVNGVSIMTSSYTGNNVTANTVATQVASRIGNGYTATANNGVITISGPSTALGFAPVVTGTGKTFTSTTFIQPVQTPFTPIYGEEFMVQYLNSANTWVTLTQYPNDGTPGEEFTPSIDLPADALWAGFKLRFSQPNGSGGNTSVGSGATGVYGRDYWHVDDVKIVELASTSLPPGSFCDTFEGDLSRWTMTGLGTAAIGSKYFQGGAHSMELKWNAVTATSKSADISGATGNITYWVKRGDSATAPVFSPATITVSGTQGNTSVSGITVNGVSIMSSAYTGTNVTANTVATQVASRITLNGFTATANNGVITVTGPTTAAGFAPVVTGTGKTFASTAFVYSGGNVQSPNTYGSDFPDAGENLVVEYLRSDNTWGALVAATSFVGGGTPGQVYSDTVSPLTNKVAIPADANMTAFQLRFRMTAGTGYDMDYWHVDDLCIGSSTRSTDLSVSLDPASTMGSPNVVDPGANTSLTVKVTNNGPDVEQGPITVTDTLANGLSFVSGSAGWNCTYTTTVVTCTRTGTLAVGADTSLVLTFKADTASSGIFPNTVTVGSGSANDPTPSNNTATNYYEFKSKIFEAYETTTASGAATGSIYTKLAGASFNLKVIALTNGAINSSYAKTLTPDLIDGAASCTSASTLAGTSANPVNHLYAAGDAGVYTFAFTSSRAYSSVKVRMTDSDGMVGCSSDRFSIRPQAFTVTSSNANADDTGASSTATPKLIAASGNFDLTADTGTVGYGGTPNINAAGVEGHAGAAVAGTVSGSFTTAADPASGNGAGGAAFTYNEAGYFRFIAGGVYDSTFTAVDSAQNHCVANSSSNVADASGMFGCNIGSGTSVYFGRFYPHHFETVVAGAMSCSPGAGCASPVTTMSYSGQNFSTMNVVARNAAGGQMSNYRGSFAKAVDLTVVDAKGGAAIASSVGTLGGTVAVSAADFVTGIAGVNTNFAFATTPTTPTSVFLRAEESAGDGVTTLLTPSSSSAEGGVRIVSGRFKVSSAYGSERRALTLQATAQYYSTSGWLNSGTDSSTGLTLAASYDVMKGGVKTGTTTPVPSGSMTLNSGVRSIVLSAPGAGVTGTATVSPTGVPSYLPLTPGTATFGVYKNNNNFIYRREN